MSRVLLTITVAALACSLVGADEASAGHDPLARWLNRYSHRVMEGTVAMMALVGDHDTIDAAAVTFDSMVVSLGASEGLKLVIDQPRPRDPAAGDGFPSSHASTAFAFARGLSDWRSDWTVAAYAFAAGVGWARVQEGYHSLEQVLAGAALGTWIAGASLQNDGFIMHRGEEPMNPMAPHEVNPEQTQGFGGGPTVVLITESW